MLENIFWGMASLDVENFEKYIAIENRDNKYNKFSFYINDRSFFIRSNFITTKEIISYLYVQDMASFRYIQKPISSKIEIVNNQCAILFFSDTFGVLTLYWIQIDNAIIFSNSSYFLAKLLGKSPLGLEGLFTHLVLRGQTNKTSYFCDILQLPPQSILKFDESGVSISKREISVFPNASISELLLKDIPANVVTNSGISFSGGIDSSVIVNECLGIDKNISCYSLVNLNNDNLKTDLHFADVLASQQHFNITEVEFQINKDIFYYDMPILDHDIYGQYCLAHAMIQDGKKYMISGNGADELFGGYDRIFYFAHELCTQHRGNPLEYLLQRYSYTDFKLLKHIDRNLFTDVYHNIKEYYVNTTASSCNIVSKLHYWFIYHHLFWILKMQPKNLICIYPYLREEFLSFCLQTDYRLVFPYITVNQADSSYNMKVKGIIKEQYKYFLPPEILNRPKLPFSIQDTEIEQWYELQYRERQPDYLISSDIFEEIMTRKYGCQTKLLFLSYILWRQRVL